MPRPASIRHRTLNWSACNAPLRARGSLTVRFDPATPRHAAPSGKRGGQPVRSAAAIRACLTAKVLSGLPRRQAAGFVARLSEARGARPAGAGPFDALPAAEDAGCGDCPAVAAAARCTFAHRPRGHQGPRDRRTARAQAWRRPQAGSPWPLGPVARPGERRKVHPAVAEGTLEVRAVEITGSDAGHAPVLPDPRGPDPRGAKQSPPSWLTALATAAAAAAAVANRIADVAVPAQRQAVQEA